MQPVHDVDKNTVFERFASGELGYKRAVYLGGFANYSEFLDEYYAKGYHYPIPPAHELAQESEELCTIVHTILKEMGDVSGMQVTAS